MKSKNGSILQSLNTQQKKRLMINALHTRQYHDGPGTNHSGVAHADVDI